MLANVAASTLSPLPLCRPGQVLGKPIEHPSAWYAKDMQQRQAEWVYQLTEGDVAELEAALAAAERSGKAVQVAG